MRANRSLHRLLLPLHHQSIGWTKTQFTHHPERLDRTFKKIWKNLNQWKFMEMSRKIRVYLVHPKKIWTFNTCSTTNGERKIKLESHGGIGTFFAGKKLVNLFIFITEFKLNNLDFYEKIALLIISLFFYPPVHSKKSVHASMIPNPPFMVLNKKNCQKKKYNLKNHLYQRKNYH